MIQRIFRLLILVVLLSISNYTIAQNKILKKLFSNTKDSTRSSSFLPMPVLGYAQETGFEFGVFALYSFYTDRQDTLTRNSAITGVATYTTQKQSNFLVKADLWAPQNKYHYVGEIRFRDAPYNFYGTGDDTRDADKIFLGQKLFRLSAEIEKKMRPVSFTGLNAMFENYQFDENEFGSIFNSNPYINGQNGGKVLFLGISQIIDTRNNNTYTSKGTYIKLNYAYAPALFGNDNFEGSQTKIDVRSYKTLNNKTVLGFNSIYQTLQGTNTPFYLLPQLGNDMIMRGYYTGRYRDQNLLAAQAELRYRFHPRMGVVGFLGGGTAFRNRGINLEGIKPSYGAGMRYFFDVERGLSIRLDYGVGEKLPNEKRQTGFYISLGEAF